MLSHCFVCTAILLMAFSVQCDVISNLINEIKEWTHYYGLSGVLSEYGVIENFEAQKNFKKEVDDQNVESSLEKPITTDETNDIEQFNKEHDGGNNDFKYGSGARNFKEKQFSRHSINNKDTTLEKGKATNIPIEPDEDDYKIILHDDMVKIILPSDEENVYTEETHFDKEKVPILEENKIPSKNVMDDSSGLLDTFSREDRNIENMLEESISEGYLETSLGDDRTVNDMLEVSDSQVNSETPSTDNKDDENILEVSDSQVNSETPSTDNKDDENILDESDNEKYIKTKLTDDKDHENILKVSDSKVYIEAPLEDDKHDENIISKLYECENDDNSQSSCPLK
uniref:Uncharacterized protein n=2 Tax=Clastoptera arizonana TaxID=38151 RepID=A0A1B6E0Q8_9HEMI